MIFLDRPFVSDFLKQTIKDNSLPVVKTEIVKEFDLDDASYMIDEQDAIETAKSTDGMKVYATSENSIGWIAENLSFTDLPEKIDLFKDKAKFRNLIKPMYPDFYFREVPLEELRNLCVEDIPKPFIIKPDIGFFSMGVYKVSDMKEWGRTLNIINSEVLSARDLYPVEVLNTASFIIEQYIDGEEFAIDAYFNSKGEPVILNILNHMFSSDEDVSDRIYISSKKIIEDNITQFSAFLDEIGRLSGVKNFPVHAELRRNCKGSVVPVEINPMRFGGWCSTPDLTWMAYGFNPYMYYFSEKKPDWSEILKDKGDRLYSVIVLDNSTGIEKERIAAFEYDKLLSNLEKPLELRKIDYSRYPVFGFLFAETKKDNFSELEKILRSDLSEFVTVISDNDKGGKGFE